jgi:hypothetical protein
MSLHELSSVEPVAAASPPAGVGSRAAALVPRSKRLPFGWVLEIVGIGIVMVVHDLFRNELTGGRVESLRRARAFEDVERWLGLNHELSIQRFFIDLGPWCVAAWNIFYQWAHFFVPIVAAVYLYRRFPSRYLRWRNIFLIMLFVTGPLGWWAFPVTPPKYLPARDGFVDTQVEYFSIGTQQRLEYGRDGEPRADLINALGNTYSGMPSHHVSWALWAVLALWPVVRRRWVKGLLALHLVLTVTGIIVTGNHHVIDVAGSCVEVALAFCLALGFETWCAYWRRGRRRRPYGVTDVDVVTAR